MINIQNKVDCCGCNACGDVCAHKAITFKTDNEGFWYPEVDKEKCVDCGLCEKVCPIINIDTLKKNDFIEPICYAAIHKNYEVRFDSTSGGMFSAFAEKFYRDKGYVGGAIYNDDWSVKQYISADKADLPKLRSSKYQQSSFEGFYRQVRDLVKQGEKVLVCGSPCQMAALRAFLNHKDYENLLILDYVCRGINSPLVAQKFNEYLERKHGSKITYKKAKNKEFGWRSLTTKVRFANGDNEYMTKENSIFNRGYLQTNAYCRPSCYDCKFKGFPRMADITLADFWGIENYDKSLDDNIGTSMVLINSEKGRRFFEAIEQKIRCVKLYYEDAIKGNVALLNSLPPSKVDREKFFEDVNSMNFEDVAEKHYPDPRKIPSKKKDIHTILSVLMSVWRYSPITSIRPKLQFLKYNFFHKAIRSHITKNGYFLFGSHVVMDISKKAHIELNAPVKLGDKKFQKSKLETRFMVNAGGTFIADSQFRISYGSDIEVFPGATLKIGGADFYTHGGTNVNFSLVCGNYIELGYGVAIGRNVTIRDNNGDHYLSMQGYKTSKPVKIGNHVWLCEGCTIMQGVTIGDGAIIGTHAVVTSNVPPYSLVAGNPAKVIQTNVFWKL